MANLIKKNHALLAIVSECKRNLDRFEKLDRGYYAVKIFGKETHHKYMVKISENDLRIIDDDELEYLFVCSTEEASKLIKGLYKAAKEAEKEAAIAKENEWFDYIASEFKIDTCPFADDEEDGCQ